MGLLCAGDFSEALAQNNFLTLFQTLRLDLLRVKSRPGTLSTTAGYAGVPAEGSRNVVMTNVTSCELIHGHLGS